MIGITKRIILIVGFIPALLIGLASALVYSAVMLCLLPIAAIEWILRGKSDVIKINDSACDPERVVVYPAAALMALCLPDPKDN